MEWYSCFIHLFNSSTCKDTSIHAVTKLKYLLSLLSGKPRNLIKALPFSDAYYLVANDLLKERYHSPRR